jgi:hypothetical protein
MDGIKPPGSTSVITPPSEPKTESPQVVPAGACKPAEPALTELGHLSKDQGLGQSGSVATPMLAEPRLPHGPALLFVSLSGKLGAGAPVVQAHGPAEKGTYDDAFANLAQALQKLADPQSPQQLKLGQWMAGVEFGMEVDSPLMRGVQGLQTALQAVLPESQELFGQFAEYFADRFRIQGMDDLEAAYRGELVAKIMVAAQTCMHVGGLRQDDAAAGGPAGLASGAGHKLGEGLQRMLAGMAELIRQNTVPFASGPLRI